MEPRDGATQSRQALSPHASLPTWTSWSSGCAGLLTTYVPPPPGEQLRRIFTLVETSALEFR